MERNRRIFEDFLGLCVEELWGRVSFWSSLRARLHQNLKFMTFIFIVRLESCSDLINFVFLEVLLFLLVFSYFRLFFWTSCPLLFLWLIIIKFQFLSQKKKKNSVSISNIVPVMHIWCYIVFNTTVSNFVSLQLSSSISNILWFKVYKEDLLEPLLQTIFALSGPKTAILVCIT